MYKEHMALNNLQWLICHKTQPNQAKPNHIESSYQLFAQISNLALVYAINTAESLPQFSMGTSHFWPCARLK